MKLEMTEGCTCWSYTADNKQFVDLTIEEQRGLIKTLIDHTDDPVVLQDYFRDYMQTYGEYEGSDEPCECCGDYIETYTLEIPDEDTNNN